MWAFFNTASRREYGLVRASFSTAFYLSFVCLYLDLYFVFPFRVDVFYLVLYDEVIALLQKNKIKNFRISKINRDILKLIWTLIKNKLNYDIKISKDSIEVHYNSVVDSSQSHIFLIMYSLPHLIPFTLSITALTNSSRLVEF